MGFVAATTGNSRMVVGVVVRPPVCAAHWVVQSHGLWCTVRSMTSSHLAFNGGIAVLILRGQHPGMWSNLNVGCFSVERLFQKEDHGRSRVSKTPGPLAYGRGHP